MAQTTAERPVETWSNHRYEVVPIDKLFVDQDYQRRLTAYAKAIAHSWVPALVNTLVVSARKEQGNAFTERGAVIDGQTRLAAAKLRNEMIKNGEMEGELILALPCVVYSGLTKRDEAELFDWLNTQTRSVPTYDRYRASLVAENPESHAMKEIVEAAGYEIGYAGMSENTITAVGTLRKMMRQDVVAFERTLVIFREAWKTNYLPSGWQLRGMFKFLRDNPDIDDEKLVRRLFITSPHDLDKKANAAKEFGGTGNNDVHMADAVGSIYRITENRVEKELARL